MTEDSKKLTNKQIGERLRELRQSKKMKQEDMAAVLGISVPAYSKIETGVNEISSKHLLTLKKKFNVSIDWLLCGEITNNAKGFGINDEHVEKMLADMKKWKTVLFSILSHYYGIIDAASRTNVKEEKDLPTEGES
jgi:transcriptional regulator with XRE-family HTH domain